MSIEFDSAWLAAQNMDESLPTSELAVLVSEVNVLTCQAVQNFLVIGQKLTQIKAIVGHGNFKDYVREHCGYSQDMAQRFMRMAAEYAPETAPLALGATKMYELLSLPAADRDDFIQTHDVESLTVRELRAQIAQEKERTAQAEAARKAAEEQRRGGNLRAAGDDGGTACVRI